MTFLKILLATAVSAVVFSLLSSCMTAPGYQGAKSDHFDGTYFNNRRPWKDSFWRFLKWQMNGEKVPWPDWIDAEQKKIPRERVGTGELSVTFINHATTLIQVDGLNILTDPIWSKRCSPFSWIGPSRVRPPGVKLEDLPPIDAVIVSHNHYDHLDIPTLQMLESIGFGGPIYAGLGNNLLFEDESIKGGVDMDWWQTETLKGIEITFVPGRHFSGRGIGDRMKTLWGGFVISSSKGPIYFAGDTAYDKHFDEIHRKFGDVRLALLPIGAYKPRWFMKQSHVNPEEAVKAHLELGAASSLAIHFNTFQLTDEGIDEPVKDLHAALERYDVPREKFFVIAEGESREIF